MVTINGSSRIREHRQLSSISKRTTKPRRLRGLACIFLIVFAAAIASSGLFVLLLTNAAAEQSLSPTHAESNIYGQDLRRTNRFPQYGTPGYSRRCKWLLDAAEKQRRPLLSTATSIGTSNCTFYYGLKQSRPSEGMSFWITQVVSSHLLALQAGCRLLIDYGDKIDLSQILTVPDRRFDWTVPPGYSCEDDINCYQIDGWSLKGKTITKEINTPGQNQPLTLAPVPRYRYAYGLERFRQGDNLTVDLERVLPGFDIHDGMACSLGALFKLSPRASRFEPTLFETILPALMDDDAIVIGVYIRTGWTDKVARHTGNDVANETEYREEAQRLVDAVLNIERTYLGREHGPGPPSQPMHVLRIAWMVTTDWPLIKDWIIDTYDGGDANENLPNNERKYANTKVPRRVITTRAEGKQTKLNDRPATSDFAEGLLDWWLLGMSDLVVKHRYSFAETAALRTAAPVYQGETYKPLLAHADTLVHINKDGSNEDVEKGSEGWEEEKKKSLVDRKVHIEVDLRRKKSYKLTGAVNVT